MNSAGGKSQRALRNEMPSTSFQRTGKPGKRLVVEILSDSEDEADPRLQAPNEVKDEAASPGVLAMENLYKRIRRDTLGMSSMGKGDRNPPEKITEPIEVSNLCSTQVLETYRDLSSFDANKDRKRSSSRDSNETLILPRRYRRWPESESPPHVLAPVTPLEKKPFPRAIRKETSRNTLVRDLKKPPPTKTDAKQNDPGEAGAKRISPRRTTAKKLPAKKADAKQVFCERNDAKQASSKRSLVKEHSAGKTSVYQGFPREDSRKQDSQPSLRTINATRFHPHQKSSQGTLEPTAAVVSHEPFDFNVKLNPKIKTAIQEHNKKPATGKRSSLKRLAKSPLKKKQLVKSIPAKKIVKPATIVKTETDLPQLSNEIPDLGNTEAESIDVDDQIVSPLMSDGLWDTFEVISKRCSTNYTLVKSIIGMVEKSFTLPFICRYRRDQSGGLAPEVIQSIRDEYMTLIEVRKKAKALVTKLENEGNKDKDLKQAILSARTLEELNVIMEPLRQKGRKTFAARARSIGLEEIAMPIWRGEKTLGDFNLMNFVDASTPGKADLKDLLQSVRYILADELRRSRTVLDRMEESSRLETELHVKQKKTKTSAVIAGKESSDNFRDYFDFVRKVTAVESHKVMAINRGEQLGFLSVSIHLMPFFEKNFKQCLVQQFDTKCLVDAATRSLIREAVDDSYERLCKPYISRVARAHLKDRAEKEALTVFSANLRALLMTPPVRGESVLGIDPGFAKGCKLAVISKSGDLLESDLMYLSNRPEQVLTKLVRKHKCRLIAVGDGKGGQEVKGLITSCNKRKLFGEQPVRFTTVREAGVSIYSVSKAAEEELPGLDCFVRGAVAIARRLQDPLVEFIKVEPKNLGIGMYQHDINEARLKEALQSTVVECVSYVGVDINVCPEFLLRQVAGLNASAAKNIIAYRKEHGPFKNREQLQQVPQIGPKRYEQCAGFVKILPETLKQCLDESLIVLKVKKPNEKAISEELQPLDSTIIHPESYGLARRIISDLGLDVRDIGTQSFIDKVEEKSKAVDFALKFNAPFLTIELILKALKARRNSDVRDEGSAPIFCAGSISMASIQIGQKVSGRVENVVPFGAFVDIAMDKKALIHTGVLGAARGVIKLGDIVECRVVKKDLARQRISLAFESFK